MNILFKNIIKIINIKCKYYIRQIRLKFCYKFLFTLISCKTITVYPNIFHKINLFYFGYTIKMIDRIEQFISNTIVKFRINDKYLY